jgi:hypothetical protein
MGNRNPTNVSYMNNSELSVNLSCNPKKSIGLLDLNGYMFSGKAAISDLIREFDGISVPNYREEFDLIRIPGGLADLMRAFDSGSLIAVDHALRAYLRLVETFGIGLEKDVQL